jgi:hypothetical protein
MQILGLLGMYFDAVVVEVEKYVYSFQVGVGHTVAPSTNTLQSIALLLTLTSIS